MVWQSLSLRFGRWRYRHAALAELRRCWQYTPVSIHKNSGFLAVDLETTSLSADEGEVVSLAWVVIENGWIQMPAARHIMVTGKQSVGNSAEIHQLRDCEREQGVAAECALREFLEAARGRCLIFHHAGLDRAYLDRLSKKFLGSPLWLPYLDTMAIERRRLLRSQDVLNPGDLRLARCRGRYGLPAYPAHNAFNDALATAELYLAQGRK